jgi:anti-sigma regulatory factor (Ser/Thr protein kinase)
MQLCNQCSTNVNCHSCLEFFEGGALRKKVFPAVPVQMTDDKGQQYFGKLIAISPVGMLIETEAPVQDYMVNINHTIKARVSPIYQKGISNPIPFDIVEVFRKNTVGKRLSKEEYNSFFTNKRELIRNLTENLNTETKEKIRQELYLELAKSELLDRMVVGNSYIYEKGNIRLLSGNANLPIRERDLLPIMQEALRKQKPARHVIIDVEQEKYIDVHALPLGYQTGGFITLDISDIVKKEKQLLQEQWENYKDIILSLTKGKIQLLNQTEMDALLTNYEKQSFLEVDDAKQMAAMRSILKEEIVLHNIPLFRISLATTEAVTNALKHAKKCMVEVWYNAHSVLILVSDQGKGIKMKDLPKATLVEGFSTHQSLGKGFHVMAQSTDKLYLKSDPSGTMVGLLFNK